MALTHNVGAYPVQGAFGQLSPFGNSPLFQQHQQQQQQVLHQSSLTQPMPQLFAPELTNGNAALADPMATAGSLGVASASGTGSNLNTNNFHSVSDADTACAGGMTQQWQ